MIENEYLGLEETEDTPIENDLYSDEPIEESEPATPAYVTRDDFNRMYGELRELLGSQKAEPEPAPTDWANLTYAPEADARQAIRLEEQMVREAKELYPDLPMDAEDALREKLGNFRTLTELREARKNNYHKLLADAEYGKLVREGKHVPTKFRTTRTEPVHTESPRTVDASTRSEIEQIERLTGQKFSDKELKAMGVGR
jgi:hypothetical protein